MRFLHGRPWISSQMKLISNDLDITFRVIPSQLPGPIKHYAFYCDVITETSVREKRSVFFIAIYRLIMLRKKYMQHHHSIISLTPLMDLHSVT